MNREELNIGTIEGPTSRALPWALYIHLAISGFVLDEKLQRNTSKLTVTLGIYINNLNTSIFFSLRDFGLSSSKVVIGSGSKY